MKKVFYFSAVILFMSLPLLCICGHVCIQTCIICNNLHRITENDDDDTAEEQGTTKPQRFSF